MKPIFLSLLFPFLVIYNLDTIQAATIDTVTTYSKSMNKNIKAIVIKPNNYKSVDAFPTVYLLHGHGGSYLNWIKNVPDLSQQVDLYSFIIVCPDGNVSSWYLDSPVDENWKYETYTAIELVSWIDEHYKTIKEAKARAITGLSMGGHGSLYLAFKHQDVFGAAGSMSGGVDIRPFPENWDIKKRLGTLTEFPENWEKNTVTNMLELVKDNKLKMIIDCGVDDFFMDVNRELHNKMLTLKINHDYIERPGKHNIEYWENSLKFQLLFFDNFFKENKLK